MGQNFDDYPGPAQNNTCLKICNTVYIFNIPRHLHLTGVLCLSLVAHCAKAAETSNVNIVRRRGNSSSKHWPLGLESRPLHVSDV